MFLDAFPLVRNLSSGGNRAYGSRTQERGGSLGEIICEEMEL